VKASEVFRDFEGLAVNVAVKVWRHYQHVLAAGADLEDACQVARLQLWELAPTLDPGRCNGGYIHTCLWYSLTHWAKRLAREHHAPLPADPPARPSPNPAALCDAHGGNLRGISDFPR
jgi:DNA-directed RNA polymerase specialized sigma24 family protein